MPGTPGAPWSHQEVLAVKSKLYSIFGRWGGNDALKQIYDINCTRFCKFLLNGQYLSAIQITCGKTSRILAPLHGAAMTINNVVQYPCTSRGRHELMWFACHGRMTLLPIIIYTKRIDFMNL